MRLIKTGDIAHPIVFLLINSSDHISGATEKTPAISVSKDGGAFAAVPDPQFSGLAYGWYAYTPASGVVDTTGSLVLHVEAAGCDPVDMLFQVVAFDPNSDVSLGLSNLDAQVSSRLQDSSYQTPPSVETIQSGLARTSDLSPLATAAAVEALQTTTDAILQDTGETGVAVADKDGYSLTSSERTAIAAAVWDAPAKIVTSVIEPVTVDLSAVAQASDLAALNAVLSQIYGTGSKRTDYQVTESGTGKKIAGATVWVTSDAAGQVMVAGPQLSNEQGITFWLLPTGTYYFWRHAPEHRATNPEIVTVS